MRYLVIALCLVVILCPLASAADEVPYTEDIAESPDWQLVDVRVMQAPVAPVVSADGLKGALLGIIGQYNPPVVEYQYQNYNQSQYSYLREVVPDYPWIGACLVLLLLLYGLIRLGGTLCRR